jgi:hypothetical protein
LQTGLFCQQCQRWWHARCLPKELQQIGKSDPDAFRCSICAGLEVERRHAVGRVRHNSIPHQILNMLAAVYRKVAGDEAKKRESEVKAHLELFHTMHSEIGRIREVHQAVYSYIASFDELSQVMIGAVMDDRTRFTSFASSPPEQSLTMICSPRRACAWPVRTKRCQTSCAEWCCTLKSCPSGR